MAESPRTPVRTPVQLQGIAREFRAQQMVADEVAPPRTVDEETGKYTVYGRDDLYEVDNTWRPGAIPNAISSRESEDTYATEMRVIRHALHDRDANRSDGVTRRNRITTKVTLATWIGREGRVARAFTTTGNYPGGHVLTKAGGTEWNAAGIINTVQPITDIETRIAVVTAATGATRGALDVVIPEAVYDLAIRHNSAIRDYYKYTERNVTSAEIFTQLLGVRRVLIASGRFAGTGVESATADISTGIATTSLWSDNVWVGLTDADDLDMLTFARQFRRTVDTGGQDIQIRTYRMMDEGQRGDWVEAAEERDLKITANFAGALIVNALA